ncbi:fatty acid desaturase family protein [Roseateles sp. DB2]|uniref:fatty acid desaturase family protein n=1 Tax=Roseateles sp. DB2 TaxID=3453717 RepID=UPI003EEC5C47
MNHDIDYKDLIVNRPFVFLAKFGVWAGLIAAGFHLAGAQQWWVQMLGVTLAALGFAHGVELQHQALHGIGTGNRSFDMKLGFLLGLPLLISVNHYRDRHLHHHQHVGMEDDAEFFQFSKENNNKPLRLLFNMLMLPHWVQVARLIWAAFTGGSMGRVYNKNNDSRIRGDYAAFGVILLVAAGLVVVYRPFEAVLFLAFPLAACIHTLVESPEHWNCDKTPSVFENTRTVRASWLLVWFTNGNNYHVEHHLAPALRPEALRAFHLRIASRIKYQNDSYLSLIREVLASKPRQA